MQNAHGEYLKTKVMTASKEELLIMLLDGAVRFVEQAKVKLVASEFEAFGNCVTRAQDIVMELLSSLNREELGAAIFDGLSGLYTFAHARLLQGGMKRDTKPMDEAVRVLTHLRETWTLALEKDRSESAAILTKGVAALAEVTAADDGDRPSLNLQG